MTPAQLDMLAEAKAAARIAQAPTLPRGQWKMGVAASPDPESERVRTKVRPASCRRIYY